MLGWGIPFLLNALGKLFIESISLSTSYVLVENLILMVCGIAVSHLFRYIYKFHIKWKEWSWIKLLYTSGLLLGCAILLFLLIEMFCFVAYDFFESTALERSTLEYLITFANTLIYLLFWLMLYELINYILRTQQLKLERLQVENMTKESQLNMLKGQINPHFMFNSLNNIRGLMLEDVDKARDMLTQLSEMLRFSLSRKDDNFVPLSEEIAVVHNYIALSKIQLEDRLHYEERIEHNILNIDVPPMLIQMLIENAIKHGISNLKNGGKVVLEINRNSNCLSIQITNDGSLTENTAGTKVGVQNIEQRLRLLYDQKASFSLTESNSKVIANVQIPV